MHVALPSFGAALLGLLAIGACAGRSERTADDHSAGGAGGSGGKIGAGGGAATGVGGTAAASGTNGTTGGVGGTGGSISVTGGASALGGTGGTIDLGAAGELSIADTPQCLQPRDPGTCRGAFERWRFDSATLRCVSFIYGGCGGNDNRFDTEAACRATCVTGLPPGCGDDIATMRPEGCPCVEDSQCETFCSSPSVETTGQCEPASAGYCGSPCCTEGHCLCRVTGEHGCGV